MPKVAVDDDVDSNGEGCNDGPDDEDKGAERPANGDADDAGADDGSRQNEEDDAARREAADADADEDAEEWARLGELAADSDGTRAVRLPTASETCANPRSSSTARRRRREGWTVTAGAAPGADDGSAAGQLPPSAAAPGMTLAMICTFSGFTSRCAMPQVWSAASAVATSRMMAFAAAGGR